MQPRSKPPCGSSRRGGNLLGGFGSIVLEEDGATPCARGTRGGLVVEIGGEGLRSTRTHYVPYAVSLTQSTPLSNEGRRWDDWLSTEQPPAVEAPASLSPIPFIVPRRQIASVQCTPLLSTPPRLSVFLSPRSLTSPSTLPSPDLPTPHSNGDLQCTGHQQRHSHSHGWSSWSGTRVGTPAR